MVEALEFGSRGAVEAGWWTFGEGEGGARVSAGCGTGEWARWRWACGGFGGCGGGGAGCGFDICNYFRSLGWTVGFGNYLARIDNETLVGDLFALHEAGIEPVKLQDQDAVIEIWPCRDLIRRDLIVR